MGRSWTAAQATEQTQRLAAVKPQLTTFDIAQYPGQRRVAVPTDGRGSLPTSYGTYPDMISGLPTGVFNRAPLPTYQYQKTTVKPSFGGTTQLGKLSQMITNKCRCISGKCNG